MLKLLTLELACHSEQSKESLLMLQDNSDLIYTTLRQTQETYQKETENHGKTGVFQDVYWLTLLSNCKV
jgi:hypothetical protein